MYNGQIYNTKELKKTLEENNFTFETHSDTEILLKSYIYYGKDFGILKKKNYLCQEIILE